MKSFFILLISIFASFSFPNSVFAQETINNFEVKINASKDGSFEVQENITYDFGGELRHGIFRNIPYVSKVGDLFRIIEIDVKDVLRDGVSEGFVLSKDNSKFSIKIGDPDKTISGEHSYQISYLVKNGIGSNFEDHDEIYWNITGNEWKVPIKRSTAILSTDFGVNPNKAICFTGVSGSTAKSCDVSSDFKISTISGLGIQQGLTAVWGFEKGTYPPSVLQRNPPGYVDPRIIKYGLIAWFVLLNILIPGLVLNWYFKNKRKERFGAPSVNFDIPKDSKGKVVSPAEAGSIDIHKVDQNDVIATIFDLAVRKYLKIEEKKKSKVLGVFGGGEEYIFHKTKEVNKDISSFEEVLMDRFFESSKSIEMSSLKSDFYLTFTDFEKSVFESLVSRGFYTKNPKNQMAILLVCGIVFLFIGGLVLGGLIIFLSRKLNGRTVLGDEIDWKINGLKIFLKNMKRHHAFQAKNLITVERYIPYAISFGYIKEFMDQLKEIYPNYKPSWYIGHSVFYLSSNNMFSSMDTFVTTSAPSSSSGFSGGGSGGGGGGGGGGSW